VPDAEAAEPTTSAALPLFSACAFTTPDTTFEEDLALAIEIGAQGVGICEFKLRDGEEAAQLAAMADSGLRASICMPAHISPLPTGVVFPGPEDIDERVALMCASVRRLAPFQPESIVVITGALRERTPQEARRIVVEGLREVARVAAGENMRLGLEPQRVDVLPGRSLVSTIPETLDLLEEIGSDNIDIVYDVYHLFETEDIVELTRRHASAFGGVQICDWRAQTRGWMDRVLPGDGVIDLPALFAALDDGGYAGWYDLEVFSDDGRYGADYPDSLWKLPPRQVLEAGLAGFRRAWEMRAGLAPPDAGA
jgi:sugar phosphate isomerase/epimerase